MLRRKKWLVNMRESWPDRSETVWLNKTIKACLCRYEQLAEQEERSYQQLRKKLYSELQQERDKLTAEMHGHNNAIENQVKGLKVSSYQQECYFHMSFAILRKLIILN